MNSVSSRTRTLSLRFPSKMTGNSQDSSKDCFLGSDSLISMLKVHIPHRNRCYHYYSIIRKSKWHGIFLLERGAVPTSTQLHSGLRIPAQESQKIRDQCHPPALSRILTCRKEQQQVP